jgi:hypothetical protein
MVMIISSGLPEERNYVVLSVAKDLIAACNRHEILRFAQDDTLKGVSC